MGEPRFTRPGSISRCSTEPAARFPPIRVTIPLAGAAVAADEILHPTSRKGASNQTCLGLARVDPAIFIIIEIGPQQWIVARLVRSPSSKPTASDPASPLDRARRRALETPVAAPGKWPHGSPGKWGHPIMIAGECSTRKPSGVCRALPNDTISPRRAWRSMHRVDRHGMPAAVPTCCAPSSCRACSSSRLASLSARAHSCASRAPVRRARGIVVTAPDLRTQHDPPWSPIHKRPQ